MTALYSVRCVQRRGIGRALMNRAFEYARGVGWSGLILTVLADNPAAVFYEAIGGTSPPNGPAAGTRFGLASRVFWWPVG